MDPSKIVIPKPESFISFATYTFPLAMFILMPFAFQTTKESGNIWNVYTISILVLFPMAALSAILYTNQVFIPAFSNFFVFMLGLLFMTILAIIVYNTVLAYISKIKSIYYIFLVVAAVLLGFAVLFGILSYFFTSQAMRAFLQVFFSIPALIFNTMEEFFHQFPSAPPTFIILFIIEVILIILVVLIPLLIAQNPPFYSSLQFNGVHLLQKDPVDLGKKQEQVIANSHMLSIVDDPTTEKNPYQKQFSLSMWVYMNPSEAAQNSNEITLLYYGTKTKDKQDPKKWQIKNPKPKVTYQYDPHMRRDMYNIYLQEETPTTPTYRFHIPNQKWNQFVFVYQADHIDLFINGHLEKTFPQSMGITKTYLPSDQIAIGDLNTTSYGAVANIIYYDYPMTVNQITDAWNKQRYWVDGTLYVPFSKNSSTPIK